MGNRDTRWPFERSSGNRMTPSPTIIFVVVVNPFKLSPLFFDLPHTYVHTHSRMRTWSKSTSSVCDVSLITSLITSLIICPFFARGKPRSTSCNRVSSPLPANCAPSVYHPSSIEVNHHASNRFHSGENSSFFFFFSLPFSPPGRFKRYYKVE